MPHDTSKTQTSGIEVRQPPSGSDRSSAEPKTMAAPTYRVPPFWIFAVLPIPVAVTIPLSFLLRREGVPVPDIANEVALISLPQMLYFLWSPVVDMWLQRKTWLVLSAAVGALLTVTVFYIPSLASTSAVLLLLAGQGVVMLSASASGALKAQLVPPEQRARVSGWAQAGNMAAKTLSSGGLIALAARCSRPTLGILTGILMVVPASAALFINEPPIESIRGPYSDNIRQIYQELKRTFFRWAALPSLMLVVSPLGSGATIALLPGIAQDYGLSTDQTAWVTGLGGGMLTAAGATLLMFIPKSADLKMVYSWAGLANAVVVGILCVGPARPFSYLLGAILYFISSGAAWAAFAAVVLELIGDGGKGMGTRYSIAVSLGNISFGYMTFLGGLGARWWGSRGLAAMDMIVSGITATAFIVWLRTTKPKPKRGL